MNEIKFHISKSEQETCITWYADDEAVKVCTSDTKMIRILDEKAEKYPDYYVKQYALTRERNAQYVIPIKLLRFANPATDKQRAQRAAALSKAQKRVSA